MLQHAFLHRNRCEQALNWLQIKSMHNPTYLLIAHIRTCYINMCTGVTNINTCSRQPYKKALHQMTRVTGQKNSTYLPSSKPFAICQPGISASLQAPCPHFPTSVSQYCNTQFTNLIFQKQVQRIPSYLPWRVVINRQFNCASFHFSLFGLWRLIRLLVFRCCLCSLKVRSKTKTISQTTQEMWNKFLTKSTLMPCLIRGVILHYIL